MRAFLKATLALGAMSAAFPALANQRHYTYTYETATLPMGAAELENTTTIRLIREDYYARFDHRLEFEIGLIDALQAALYVNFHEQAKGEPVVSESAFDGVSLELKGKLTDPVADPLGVGLYLEIGGSPTAVEVEGKLLLEKQIGDANLSINLIYEAEFERDEADLELDAHVAAIAVGAAWFATPNWSIGAELVSRTKIAKQGDSLELDYSALFLGPTVAYSAEKYWLAATVLPQIAALAGARDGRVLALGSRERLEIRLILALEM